MNTKTLSVKMARWIGSPTILLQSGVLFHWLGAFWCGVVLLSIGIAIGQFITNIQKPNLSKSQQHFWEVDHLIRLRGAQSSLSLTFERKYREDFETFGYLLGRRWNWFGFFSDFHGNYHHPILSFPFPSKSFQLSPLILLPTYLLSIIPSNVARLSFVSFEYSLLNFPCFSLIFE